MTKSGDFPLRVFGKNWEEFPVSLLLLAQLSTQLSLLRFWRSRASHFRALFRGFVICLFFSHFAANRWSTTCRIPGKVPNFPKICSVLPPEPVCQEFHVRTKSSSTICRFLPEVQNPAECPILLLQNRPRNRTLEPYYSVQLLEQVCQGRRLMTKNWSPLVYERRFAPTRVFT